MQGLQLKRQGCSVTILEKDSATDRASHLAGLSFRTNVGALLDEYAFNGIAVAAAPRTTQWSFGTRSNVLVTGSDLKVTSWGHFYRMLRANYDGLASSSYPNPPPSRDGDGEARFLSGKQATDLSCLDNIVTVRYVDVKTGVEGKIESDLVIGADGSRSTVRGLIQAPTKREYSGYIAWRATVPEKLLSDKTAGYFSESVSLNQLRRSYIMGYVHNSPPYPLCSFYSQHSPRSYYIPTDQGSFEPGERLINLVWYYNVPEDSDEMKSIFTDKHGIIHRNTVAPNALQPSAWKRVRDAFAPRFSAPFVEVLYLIETPFVTKINDALCSQPSFFNGRGFLIGDALTTLRPHTGSAAEMAAFHSLALAPVLKGAKTVEAWKREVLVYSKRMWLIGRLVGIYGQGSMLSLLRAVFNYIIFIVGVKIGIPNVA
jgi:2-polyprenyl-6-methoxyphenol hydroxylase-like FAD-dependent oxidoreductase